MTYYEMIDKYPAFAGYSSYENSKYRLFSVPSAKFEEFFNPVIEIKPEDTITFFKKGKDSMQNVHGNKVVRPEKAKYLVFPVNTSSKNMRSNFSVIKDSYSYVFSKAWCEYLPLILEGKLIPISYDNYAVNRNFILTLENIRPLCDMMISNDHESKKLAWSIIYSINLEKSDPGLVELIVFLIKEYNAKPNNDSTDYIYYERYLSRYIPKNNSIPLDLYNEYAIPYIERDIKRLLDIYHPHAIFEEIKLKKYEHLTNTKF